MVGLGNLTTTGNGAQSYGYGVSADGSVVVGLGTGGLGAQAFRWMASTGMASVGLVSNNYATGTPVSISADGSVIAGTNQNGQVFRWTAATGMVGLGCLGTQGSCQANAVSGDGNVIVGEALGTGGDLAVRWTPTNGWIGLGQVPGGQMNCCSGANAVNADGSVVVGGT
jgi:uncharacterized membrane protein